MVNPKQDGAAMEALFERVRAWIHGQLEPAEVERLRGELARNPEAAEFADEYREIHGVTQALDGPGATSTLDFATLQRRFDAETRTARWRKVAAAAALVFVAGATWLMLARESAPSHAPAVEPLRLSAVEPLRLSAIKLDASAPTTAPAEFPELEQFAPVEDGEIRWVADLASGTALAEASGRPLLLFGMFPTCPWCQQMKEEGLRDPTVIAMIDDFVPVQIDLFELSDEDREVLLARGYPLFEVWNASGEIVHSFAGVHDAPAFVANLATGVEKAAAGRDLPSWGELQRQARAYDEALANERAGSLGLAQRTFATIEREGSSNALVAAARDGAARIASAASEALLHARDLSATDVAGAGTELAQAARRFEGSPYAADLEAARARLARDGRFPELTAGE